MKPYKRATPILLVTILFHTSSVLLKWLTWFQKENHAEQDLAFPWHHGLMEHADLTKQTFGDTSDRDYLLQISSGITSSIAERERESPPEIQGSGNH